MSRPSLGEHQNPSMVNVNQTSSQSASITLFRRLVFDGTVPIEIKLDLNELPANSDRSLEYYYIQAPRVSYLPLLISDIKRHLTELVLDELTPAKEEDWWFEETGTGALMKWHWPIGSLYDAHTISGRVASSASSTLLNGPGPSFDPTPAEPLRLTLHLVSPPTDKLLLNPSAESCKQAFMGQLKEADFLRWGNTKRVTGLRKQEQDGMWEGLREHNFEEFWRIAAKIFPTPSVSQPIHTSSFNPSLLTDPHPRSQSTEPGVGGPERDGPYSVRSVPLRIYLPDGPVVQDIVPPLGEDGRPTTLLHILRTHLPLLFPPPPSIPQAYAIIQGVVTPAEADVAWLNACLAGLDGWLSVFIGIGVL